MRVRFILQEAGFSIATVAQAIWKAAWRTRHHSILPCRSPCCFCLGCRTELPLKCRRTPTTRLRLLGSCPRYEAVAISPTTLQAISYVFACSFWRKTSLRTWRIRLPTYGTLDLGPRLNYDRGASMSTISHHQVGLIWGALIHFRNLRFWSNR